MYIEQAAHILRPKGWLILATFALDGPERCSGLEVSRYNEAGLKNIVGNRFQIIESRRDSHQTPTGNLQEMMYFVLHRSKFSPTNV